LGEGGRKDRVLKIKTKKEDERNLEKKIEEETEEPTWIPFSSVSAPQRFGIVFQSPSSWLNSKFVNTTQKI
jgi:hypothetical protein